jgi:hypothetical protein
MDRGPDIKATFLAESDQLLDAVTVGLSFDTSDGTGETPERAIRALPFGRGRPIPARAPRPVPRYLPRAFESEQLRDAVV